MKGGILKIMKMHSLQEIAQELAGVCGNVRLSGEDIVIYGASADSRDVLHDCLFICKGAAFKPEYLKDALKNGAKAYLCSEEIEPLLIKVAPDVPHIVVEDVRRAMPIASSSAFGHPERDLTLIGITGTKGKTTTAFLVRALLKELVDEPVGFISTHEIFDGHNLKTSSNTTPEAPEIYATLAKAQKNHVKFFIMEVSSQALKYDRTLGLTFAIGAFLNISPDHISPFEHLDFKDYESAKQKIFFQSKTSVVQVEWKKLAPYDAITFGIDKGTLQAKRVLAEGLAMSFSIKGLGFNDERFTLSLPGDFNVENALAALSIVRELGFSVDQMSVAIRQAFENINVSGRMEVSTSCDGHITCVVDYAHNGLSFKKFFQVMQGAFPKHFVIAVFGACGNRALNRIEELPQVAEPFVDVIVLTTDEPGPMKPEDIVHAMACAIPLHSGVYEMPDREKARELAFELGKVVEKPVLICFLGKGDENSMQIGTKSVSIEPDTKAAKRLLSTYDACQ